MTTIFLPMEPQPEIRWHKAHDSYGEVYWVSMVLPAVYTTPPYKIGDEIDMSGRYEDKFFIVKSIEPVNQGGVWKWKIEVGNV